MLVIKGGRIRQFMVNIGAGEGGGFCLANLVWNALGRLDDVQATLSPSHANYYHRVCVEALDHPARADAHVVMWGSPCGWRNWDADTPDPCQRLQTDEL